MKKAVRDEMRRIGRNSSLTLPDFAAGSPSLFRLLVSDHSLLGSFSSPIAAAAAAGPKGPPLKNPLSGSGDSLEFPNSIPAHSTQSMSQCAGATTRAITACTRRQFGTMIER